MANLSESDRKEAQSLAEAARTGGASTKALKTADVDVDDLKELFCKNWPTLKKVLEYIAGKIGGKVAGYIRAVIAAGDFLHRRVCG